MQQDDASNNSLVESGQIRLGHIKERMIKVDTLCNGLSAEELVYLLKQIEEYFALRVEIKKLDDSMMRLIHQDIDKPHNSYVEG